MTQQKRNTFLTGRDRKRGIDRQRIWEHAAIIAVLSVAILGVAITGSFSQIV